jgi:hypothetical protein
MRKGEVSMSGYINDVMDIFDAVHKLTQEIKESTRANMLKGVPHYAELIDSLEEREKQFFDALDECSKEQREFIRGYMMDLRDVQELEGDFFYMRGYTDCVVLMHRLNLLK